MNADEERSFCDFVVARGPALMRLGYLLTGGDQHAPPTTPAASTCGWRCARPCPP